MYLNKFLFLKGLMHARHEGAFMRLLVAGKALCFNAFPDNHRKGTMKFFSVIILLILPLPVDTSFSASKKHFSIGVEDFKNFLPYSDYRDKKYSGLGKDILDLFAKQKGYIFEYYVYPLKRRDRMFVKKRLDFIYPDNPNWVTNLKKMLM